MFVKPRVWVIRDVVHAHGEHSYERLFHLRRKARVRVEGNILEARDGDGPILQIINVRPATTRIEIGQGLLTFHHGRGPGSNNLKAPVAKLVCRSAGPVVDMVTVLVARKGQKDCVGVSVSEREEQARATRQGALTIHVRSAERNAQVIIPALRKGEPPEMVCGQQ